MIVEGQDATVEAGLELELVASFRCVFLYPIASCMPNVGLDEVFEASCAMNLHDDAVRRCTLWPTHDYSIEIPATYPGFR